MFFIIILVKVKKKSTDKLCKNAPDEKRTMRINETRNCFGMVNITFYVVSSTFGYYKH